MDLFYNITPSLRSNLTVNTDFAQAEVDARQVNLTRFSLLFPEKRDFFLDGALFFDFASAAAGGDGADIPFFSRRIGLDERNTPQRINFGGKLTGQAGAHDIGVLQVQTGEEDGAFGEDFTVVRVKRRMLRESYLGALYTLRHTRGGDRRQSPDHGRRPRTGDVDVSRLQKPERDRRTSCTPRTRSRPAGARLSAPTLAYPERSAECRDRVHGNPGELRRGRRVHAASRVSATSTRVVTIHRGRASIR